MEVLLVKQLNNSFKVAHNSDYEKIKKLKVGQSYKAKITKPRNLKFHRKFFALVTMVYYNQEVYDNCDRLRKDLTIAAGFYNDWIDFNGKTQIEAQSINFGAMNQETFDIMYDRVIDVIVKIYQFDKQDIIDNIEEYY